MCAGRDAFGFYCAGQLVAVLRPPRSATTDRRRADAQMQPQPDVEAEDLATDGLVRVDSAEVPHAVTPAGTAPGISVTTGEDHRCLIFGLERLVVQGGEIYYARRGGASCCCERGTVQDVTDQASGPGGDAESSPVERWLANSKPVESHESEPFDPSVPLVDLTAPGGFVGVPPPRPPSPLPVHYAPNIVAGLVACLAIVVGSLGPWATSLSVGVAGTEGDGTVTLVLAAVGAAALFAIYARGGFTKFGDRWIAPAAGVVILVIGIVDAMDVNGNEVEFMNTMVSTGIGWGLWVVLLAAAALSASSWMVARIVGNR
jgi:hypothetical protein